MPAAKKQSEPKLIEATISHGAGGGVHIRSHAAEKSDYSVFQSKKYSFGEDWTPEQAEVWIEEKRQELREFVDALATVEHAERFDASFMADTGGDYS